MWRCLILLSLCAVAAERQERKTVLNLRVFILRSYQGDPLAGGTTFCLLTSPRRANSIASCSAVRSFHIARMWSTIVISGSSGFATRWGGVAASGNGMERFIVFPIHTRWRDPLEEWPGS